ncbi:MAG: hypothetical protein EDQ89_00185 [Acidobacteria bacterium]|nr:MAG: hypothetical protein EDQ89_00185 [Acidobacteriota bacterium]
MDPTRPVAPLIFTAEARRLLALLLLQAEDERVLPASHDDDAGTILGLLYDLGLIEMERGGYVATDHLRDQVWAHELTEDPFAD